MATLVHPAGVRWLRRKWSYLTAAAVLILGAQWYFASTVAIIAQQAVIAGVARTRVDTTDAGLVYSTTWRLPWCTVLERAVFDDERAHTVSNWQSVTLGPRRTATTNNLGPCLIVQPNVTQSQVNSIGLRVERSTSNEHVMVLGCFDGHEAPIVTAWSTSTWQSEMAIGWPFKWLRYRFEADALYWPERAHLKPVGGIRVAAARYGDG